MSLRTILSVPEQSEGPEVFKKHVLDADDHLGAKCEMCSRRGLSTAVRLSVRPSVCPLLTELVRAP